MFSLFFSGMQQDLKLFLLAPAVCALFRAIFIIWYRPYKSFHGKGRAIYHCFRYGFWWGMDFNAYVLLFLLVLVTIPGAWSEYWFSLGDQLRRLGLIFYLIILYTAFLGKMLFYYHYHDVYNHILWLGKKADKNNLRDIFFNQNHGGLIIFSYIPYIYGCNLLVQFLLGLPSMEYPVVQNILLHYLFNFIVVFALIALFYYCRFGGTFKHADKPEWDEIPTVVKKDIFLAKATMDDLVTLESVWKRPMQELMEHTDEQSLKLIDKVIPPEGKNWYLQKDPLQAFRRNASGPKMKKPQHIFILFGESHSQAPFDDIYSSLNLVEASLKFRQDPHVVSWKHFLPGGEISQPALVSFLTGVYDAGLELNEKEDFWEKTFPTALPVQLRQLGYKTVFWYGGGMNWGSLQHFIPGNGFDAYMDATEFCPQDAPRTWLGIYDHVFLEKTAELIDQMEDGKPVVHFIYTTSNHGPYKMPLEKIGYHTEQVMPEAPESIKSNAADQRRLGVYWYSDQALIKFAERMKEAYPDSLMVLTGDHAMKVIPFDGGIVNRQEATIREQVCTSFAMYHPELDDKWFVGNSIGCHLNVLPTLIELIAPQGHPYYSLLSSLTEPIDHIVTPYHWLTTDKIGIHKDDIFQSLDSLPDALPTGHGDNPFLDEMKGWMEITGWLARHPEVLKTATEILDTQARTADEAIGIGRACSNEQSS